MLLIDLGGVFGANRAKGRVFDVKGGILLDTALWLTNREIAAPLLGYAAGARWSSAPPACQPLRRSLTL
jgi:hypothetical protein